MAEAQAEAERRPVWKGPVSRQRRAPWIAVAAVSIALVAGAELTWNWADDVVPGVVLAASPASRATRAPVAPAIPIRSEAPRPAALADTPKQTGPAPLEEAPHPGVARRASQAFDPGTLPRGVVPDDMPPSP